MGDIADTQQSKGTHITVRKAISDMRAALLIRQ